MVATYLQTVDDVPSCKFSFGGWGNSVGYYKRIISKMKNYSYIEEVVDIHTSLHKDGYAAGLERATHNLLSTILPKEYLDETKKACKDVGVPFYVLSLIRYDGQGVPGAAQIISRASLEQDNPDYLEAKEKVRKLLSKDEVQKVLRLLEGE